MAILRCTGYEGHALKAEKRCAGRQQAPGMEIKARARHYAAHNRGGREMRTYFTERRLYRKAGKAEQNDVGTGHHLGGICRHAGQTALERATVRSVDKQSFAPLSRAARKYSHFISAGCGNKSGSYMSEVSTSADTYFHVVRIVVLLFV